MRQQRGLEVGLDDHFHLQFSAADFPDQRNNSERQDDVFSGAIPVEKRKTDLLSVLVMAVSLSPIWTDSHINERYKNKLLTS